MKTREKLLKSLPKPGEVLDEARLDEFLIVWMYLGGITKRIPPQFTVAWGFHGKVAAAYRGEHCGFIDEAGVEVVPFRFNECRGMKDGVGGCSSR